MQYKCARRRNTPSHTAYKMEQDDGVRKVYMIALAVFVCSVCLIKGCLHGRSRMPDLHEPMPQERRRGAMMQSGLCAA